ncbi:hypothetical protein FGO68_gene2887 [Halteria grandinella]|uniref:Uncharacterized protein n=1 Tax=Halteria grandinella TaxID=5974 RepID=A0A8J8NQW6_HALGN|nr:hypothetical protein FGO68_gene2887 [Halteria grandinella]
MQLGDNTCQNLNNHLLSPTKIIIWTELIIHITPNTCERSHSDYILNLTLIFIFKTMFFNRDFSEVSLNHNSQDNLPTPSNQFRPSSSEFMGAHYCSDSEEPHEEAESASLNFIARALGPVASRSMMNHQRKERAAQKLNC